MAKGKTDVADAPLDEANGAEDAPGKARGVTSTPLSPAMRQYQQFKAQYPNYVLFFRMGDFYEMFWEDARLCNKVLGVTLTSRQKGADGAWKVYRKASTGGGEPECLGRPTEGEAGVLDLSNDGRWLLVNATSEVGAYDLYLKSLESLDAPWIPWTRGPHDLT